MLEPDTYISQLPVKSTMPKLLKIPAFMFKDKVEPVPESVAPDELVKTALEFANRIQLYPLVTTVHPDRLLKFPSAILSPSLVFPFIVILPVLFTVAPVLRLKAL